MKYVISPPRLKHFVRRYKDDMERLSKYPEHSKERDLLERRIERHKQDIINYVISESFETVLNTLDP